MKIAVENEMLKNGNSKLKNQLIQLQELGYEIICFGENFDFANQFSYISFAKDADIIDVTKKYKINIYIGLNKEQECRIKESLSVGTSTYLLLGNEDIVSQVLQIEKNRKPSIEKIWNRYYNESDLKKPFPKMSKNDFIRSKNINSDYIALEYFKSKMTYGEYDKKIIEYSEKIETLGVKSGESVALCLPNTLETMILVGALNENGIICNNIFPLSTAEQIKYCINMMGSKVAFVMDSRYRDLDSIANKTTLTNAFLVNPFESNPVLKRLVSMKDRINGIKPEESDFYLFKDFEKLPKTSFTKAPYEENRISSVQYTSGTTGVPKATLLTDDTLNARAHQYESLEVGLEPRGRFLQNIPICSKAFGEFTMHLGLANAMENVVLPTLNPEKQLDDLIKYKGQGISLPPEMWYMMVDNPKFKKTDMSNHLLISIGASGATRKAINHIGEEFKKQGFKGTPILGAGGTELGITFSTNTNTHNKYGTSGIPLIGNNVKIVDENNQELSYGQIGRVIYRPVSPSIGYANKDIKLKQNDFGIDLDDCGVIDEEGNLTVLGRIKDLIYVDNNLLYPALLEEQVNECSYVKYVYVVKPKESENKIRICYIAEDGVGDEDYSSEIMKYVPEQFAPVTEIFRLSKIPIANSLKADRNLMAGDISNILYKSSSKKYIRRKKRDK